MPKQSPQDADFCRSFHHHDSSAEQCIRRTSQRSLDIVEVIRNRPATGATGPIGMDDFDVHSTQGRHRYGRVGRHDDLELVGLRSLPQTVKGLSQSMRLKPVLDLIDRDDRAIFHRLVLDGQARQPSSPEPKARQWHLTVVQKQRVGRSRGARLKAGSQFTKRRRPEGAGRLLRCRGCLVERVRFSFENRSARVAMRIENHRRSAIAAGGKPRQCRTTSPPEVEIGSFTEPEEAELPPLARRDRASVIGLRAYDFPNGVEIRSHRQSNDEALLGIIDGIMYELAIRHQSRAVLAELALLDQVVRKLGNDCLDNNLTRQVEVVEVRVGELWVVARAEHQSDRIQQRRLSTVARTDECHQPSVDLPIRTLDTAEMLDPKSTKHHAKSPS
ncbi:MAG: hypothetical protein LKG20_03800 [Tetrasphaera jenkinsii]|nr:hypothetical protein [Tetrasphaera jenkinsii]